MASKLRAAVIGVGHMGKNHARIYHELPGVELVAVVDQHKQAAKSVAERYRCEPYLSLKTMLRRINLDVASIVTPTVFHFDHAIRLIDRGVAVLVEKPLADDVDSACCIRDRGYHPKTIIAVGHIERCNPSVRLVKELINKGEVGDIFRISTKRVGPSPHRIRDVGVTQDLAVHDLDIMRYLTDSEPVGYSAMVQRRRHNGFDDSVDALVQFKNGVVGVLECDWLTPAKYRTLHIIGSEGAIELDYIKQTIRVRRNASDHAERWVEVWREPLKIEIEEFLAAVRGKGKPAATAQDGYMAVKMAHKLLEVASG